MLNMSSVLALCISFREVQKVGLALTSSALTQYDPDRELVLDYNTSPYGVGTVLSHCWEDGSTRPVALSTRPVAFTRCSLNPA